MSKTLAFFAASLGLASAFVPSAFPGKGLAVKNNAVVSMAVDDMLGADVETNGVWDPLGLSSNEERLYNYRCMEIKHGRVAMLAILGVWTQAYQQLPDPVFNNPKPIGAFVQLCEQRPEALWQIFIAVGIVELFVWPQDTDKAPGDVGGEGWYRYPNEAKKQDKLLKELKNGRLAMLAIMGQLAQEAVSGDGPIQLIESGHLNPFGDGQGFF